MLKEQLLKDRYLQILVVACAIFAVYWVMYENYQFSTYSDMYYDIGSFLSTMYQHVSCLNVVPGLQYLVFSNHISPFLLAVVPFFAAFPSQITLYAIQEIFVALTAIVVYLVCKDLLGSRKIGLVFAFMFLISPAIRGLVSLDFHEEAFIPLFYILTFYFFWKSDRKYFAISYCLMLSLFEPAIVVGLSLLIGLLAYELLYERGKKDRAIYRSRINLLAIGAVITIIFGIFYFSLDAYLLGSYQGSLSAVQPIAVVIPYLSQQIGALTNSSAVLSFPGQQMYIEYYGPIGLAVVFLGFGATSLISPLISAILLSPWLGEVFVVGNVTFAYPQDQYFGFFAGASAVAAILGLLLLKEKRTFLSRWLDFNSRRFMIAFAAYAIVSTIILSYVILTGTNTLSSLLLSNATMANYTQVDAALATIPSNASVLTQVSMAPHLYQHCDLELPPISGYGTWYSSDVHTVFWFRPDYIVFDKSLPDYELIEDNHAGFQIYDYMKGNYTEIYNQSGLYIFKSV